MQKGAARRVCSFPGNLRLVFVLLVGFAYLPVTCAQQVNYDSGNPSAEEQYVLELINRARMNPAGEGARLGININEGLPAGRSAVVRPPLAMNEKLLAVARAHSEDMFTRNFFAHTNPDGKDTFDRMTAGGYNFTSAGENIAFGSTQMARALEDLLMVDAGIPGRGHRVNLLDIRPASQNAFVFREIGIGWKRGFANNREKSLLTQDFGRSGTGPFLLGVVYVDTNGNGFYDTGEGLSGVTVAPDTGGFRALTADAGGFAFPVGTSGTIMVTASGGALPAAVQGRVALSGQNVKVDFTPTGASRFDANVETIAMLKGPVTNGAGSTYAVLGTPESGPFGGTFQQGDTKTAAIFAGDGSVRIKVGDQAPGLANSVITKLGAPSGDVAKATLKVGAGGVTAKDNEVLLGGLTNGPVTVIARKGQDVTGLVAGVKVKSIVRFDGVGANTFFLGTLQGGDTTVAKDSALCVAPGDGSVRVVMRESDMLGVRPVSIISTLVSVTGTSGEGRWRATNDAFGVRVTFKDKGQQCFTVPATATTPANWIPWTATGDALQGGLVKTLGFPGYGSTGMAAVVTLKSGAMTIPTTSDTLVLRRDNGGTTVLAVEGNPVPDTTGVSIPNAKFKAFGTPVCGATGSTAFTATVSGVAGTSGIWYAADGVTLRQLARAGEPAAGGGRWAKFSQLALSDEAGGTPYFMGTLAGDRALGISGANNTALWAIGSNGKLIRLLRNSQDIDVNGTPRTLQSFTTFTAPSDSTGAAHGYNTADQITVRATFRDKTVALLRLTVP